MSRRSNKLQQIVNCGVLSRANDLNSLRNQRLSYRSICEQAKKGRYEERPLIGRGSAGHGVRKRSKTGGIAGVEIVARRIAELIVVKEVGEHHLELGTEALGNLNIFFTLRSTFQYGSPR